MKWITINTNIDLETGEIIPPSETEKYYIVKRNKPKYKHSECGKYKYREYTNECKLKPKQLKLWTD